jgi:hypothetical protein
MNLTHNIPKKPAAKIYITRFQATKSLKEKQENKEHITVQAHERVIDRDTQRLQEAITAGSKNLYHSFSGN